MTPPALLEIMDACDSDSDLSDADLDRINTTWANYMFELDSLRRTAEHAKPRARKGKAAVIIETPAMRALQAKAVKAEKDYMFSRKDAG
jgi:hypothetical protein